MNGALFLVGGFFSSEWCAWICAFNDWLTGVKGYLTCILDYVNSLVW
jgi:hypothetical protein